MTETSSLHDQVTVPVPPTAAADLVHEVMDEGTGPQLALANFVYAGTGSEITTFCSGIAAFGFV